MGSSVYSDAFLLLTKDSAMKRVLLPFLALVVFCGALAGCGQKGPLYLPDDENAGHSKDRFEL